VSLASDAVADTQVMPLAAQRQPSTVTRARLSEFSSPEEGQFRPGTIILERYRVMSLLGRGGMGEVYRATDLVLQQQVALKFLPASMNNTPGMVARFHNEVRIARQVSHPNVCRVYDIGEHNGAPYISMEYVDGEDLSTLLRRIGRMPADKAVEISRKLCAGLAAAHDKGVLHRDLKPANVMIDGRGQVFIMDFGLAGLASEMEGAEIRNGTPAYMAPEQLAGREVTTRSDIYSLALLLYEMFTGRKAFEAGSLAEMQRLQENATPVSITTLAKDIDPAVERVILRCLSPDPKLRPATALLVAAGLPGGDPLAAALAAGETPSPEMVAAAGENASMSTALAAGMFAVMLASLGAILFLNQGSLINQWPLEKNPAELAASAQQLIQSVGYKEKPVSTAHGFNIDGDLLVHITKDPSPRRWDQIWTRRPGLITFWYRQSPRVLEASESNDSQVSYNDPPQIGARMASVQTDTQGRLIALHAMPPEHENAMSSALEAPVDWTPLFRAADIDPASLQPAAPEWNHLEASDVRAAWTGKSPRDAAVPIRIEAAGKAGKPVAFEVIAPWTRPTRMEAARLTQGMRANQIIQIVLVLLIVAAGGLLARHNLRKKRGDVQGALRIGGVVFVLTLATYLFAATHVPTPREFTLIIAAFGRALVLGVFACFLYIALEPFLRKRWPHSLISWNIALNGDWGSPLVGRDLLVGCFTGTVWALFAMIENRVVQQYGARPHLSDLATVASLPNAIAQFLGVIDSSIANSMVIVLVLFLLRLLLPNNWLSAVGFLLFYLALSWFSLYNVLAEAPLVLLIAATIFTVMTRAGLLPYVLGISIFQALVLFPITFDVTEWWSIGTWLVCLSIVAIAAYGFHTAMGGRSLVKADFLD
jgi:predicted Ser/Thr protein kinase